MASVLPSHWRGDVDQFEGYNSGIQNCNVKENRCCRLRDVHEIIANLMKGMKRPFIKYKNENKKSLPQ